MKPSSSMWLTMIPISSMWPANITRGRPSGLSVANELPATSVSTLSAKRSASARQTRAGAASKADGPGVSRRDVRKASDSGVMVVDDIWDAKGRGHGRQCLAPAAVENPTGHQVFTTEAQRAQRAQRAQS